jgi:pimeloyl-ACP methyl ester carboxylesterase
VQDTALLPPEGRVGEVAWTALGTGHPVTVFAHGLGGSAAETRPLASRVPGTRVLVDFRGHGASGPLPESWDYGLLAADLLAVADAVGAEAAVGLSLGAGALLRLLSQRPDRFARVAFVLPAAIDAVRADASTRRLERLGEAIAAGDVERVTAILLDEVPAEVRGRRGVEVLVRRRASALSGRPAPTPMRPDRPVLDRSALSAVRVPALVVGQEADPLHRLEVATELAGLLPEGHLLALPEGGVFWTAPKQVHAAIGGHLAGDDLTRTTPPRTEGDPA